MALFKRRFINFAELKASVKIESLLVARGIELKKRGDKLVGPCPLHGGDNPNAFVVTPSKNLWYCFSQCSTGGDVIELMRRLDGVGYAQAGLNLANWLNTHITHQPKKSQRSSQESQNSQYQSDFLPYSRMLHLDPSTPFLLRKGISPQTATRFEAGAYHGRGMLAGSVAIRLHDIAGQPLGYAGRRLDIGPNSYSSKWVFPPKFPKSRILYAYHHAIRSNPNTIAIVECPWGVMRLSQLAIPSVALLGTTLSSPQIALLCHFQKIVIIMDADSAGRAAALRLLDLLSPITSASIVDLPDRCDVDDLSDAQLLSQVSPFFLS
jgi:DNA primase